MSLHHPIPSSDDSDGDLHAGFDRELDLAAERPFTGDAPRGRGRGPVPWVAAIVVSSLALAGIISLARGEPEAVADAAEPEQAPVEVEPAIVAPSVEPTPVAPEPTSRKPPRASVVHAAIVPSALPVPPVSSEDEGTQSTVAASVATPASSSRPVPAAETRDPVVPSDTRESGLALPQPAVDEATTETTPEQVAPSRTLPSVDEPSLFEDEDEPDDEPADLDDDEDEPAVAVSADAAA
ncbi:MAG: hypothetical protein AB1Z98_36580 [Nannocystaceae bacterium]